MSTEHRRGFTLHAMHTHFQRWRRALRVWSACAACAACAVARWCSELRPRYRVAAGRVAVVGFARPPSWEGGLTARRRASPGIGCCNPGSSAPWRCASPAAERFTERGTQHGSRGASSSTLNRDGVALARWPSNIKLVWLCGLERALSMRFAGRSRGGVGSGHLGTWRTWLPARGISGACGCLPEYRGRHR